MKHDLKIHPEPYAAVRRGDKPFSDFDALKFMTPLVMDLRRRAGQGVFNPRAPATRHYMEACRITAPQLGSSFLLAYEDMREPGLEVPLSCNFSLHFGQQNIPDALLRRHLAKQPEGQRELLDLPGRHQNLSMVRTAYGSFAEEAWCRTAKNPVDGTEQFHAFLFVQPDLTSGRWKPVLPSEEWCQAQGMRRLPEFFA